MELYKEWGILSWFLFFWNRKSEMYEFQVAAYGLTWSDFSTRYREVVQRIQQIRQSDYQKFVFDLDQARNFLIVEKSLFFFNYYLICQVYLRICWYFVLELKTIYKALALALDDKLDRSDMEKFFECCDLSATSYEIQEALENVS